MEAAFWNVFPQSNGGAQLWPNDHTDKARGLHSSWITSGSVSTVTRPLLSELQAALLAHHETPGEIKKKEKRHLWLLELIHITYSNIWYENLNTTDEKDQTCVRAQYPPSVSCWENQMSIHKKCTFMTLIIVNLVFPLRNIRLLCIF